MAADPSAGRGIRAVHDTDRALKELLEEVRIAQMGGQITLGFLLAVAYTPAIKAATDSDRTLYSWAIAVTAAAVILLLAPVPLHRLNFGLRSRTQILQVAHVLTLAGLAALAGAIVLSVWLASRIALPGDAPALLWWSTALTLITWLVLPYLLRLYDRSGQGRQHHD